MLGQVYTRTPLALAATMLVAGCSKNDPNFCAGAPHDNCLAIDAAVDGPKACTSNDQCTVPTGICDVTGTMMCVQCIAPDQTSACMGSMPVCSDDHACRGCSTHNECPASAACLPDGSCAADSDVAYVQAGGSGTACTKVAPCGTLDAGILANKPYVKIAAGLVKDTKTTTIDGKTVTILADPGAKLDRDGDGAILEVRSANADVKIFDLEVTGASGAAGANGIELNPNGGLPKLTLTRAKVATNQGGGISSSGGTLTVTQSTVSGNTGGGISSSGGTLTVTQSTVSGNTGGGISITSAQFDLANNIIAKNGSVTSSFGGVLVNQTNTGTRNFAFNTVTDNGGMTGSVTGVTCVLVNQPVTFSSNIVYGNQVGGAGTQVGGGGMCSWSHSDIGPQTASGTGNINMDPMFVNAMQNNFHLTANSPCKDVADPAATLANDIDGDARPQGAARDMGADEIKP